MAVSATRLGFEPIIRDSGLRETLPDIIFDPAAMESMRQAAQRAFDADADPLVGILVGRRSRTGFSVTNWRPAESGLRRVLRTMRENHPSEEPLGWLQSKHPGEPRLTRSELDAARRAFPDVPLVVLGLRPSAQRPLRVTSYALSKEGETIDERPFREFLLHTPEITPAVAVAPTPSLALDFHGLWPAALILLVAMVGILLAQMGSRPAARASTRSDALTIESHGTQRLLRWFPHDEAERATLLINRGGAPQTIALSQSQYRIAVFTLPSEPGGDVEIVLRAHRDGQTLSEAHLLVVEGPTALSAALSDPARRSPHPRQRRR